MYSDDDDDDDDEDETPVQQSQPAQEVSQQVASSPVEAEAVADDTVSDNVDAIDGNNEIQSDVAENAAKDPQQAAVNDLNFN